jgi:hypothetical protein
MQMNLEQEVDELLKEQDTRQIQEERRKVITPEFQNEIRAMTTDDLDEKFDQMNEQAQQLMIQAQFIWEEIKRRKNNA